MVQAQRVLAGDIRAVARAATWIENRSAEAEPLLRELFPHTGRALVVGVTGSPGAGKSTLCSAIVHALRRESKRVGVVAVDPSSPYTGGAILGDRIRMESHHRDEGVFIRSMATRGWLGGLAAATLDMTLLLDAAGFDVILVETVGVGQDEVEIARLADVTIVVLVPGMGDDVQALKAGIMEIADVFVINKAEDAGLAGKLERELKSYLSLSHRPDLHVPPIVKAVALERQGIDEALAAVRDYAARPGSGKAQLWAGRLREMLRERLTALVDWDEFLRAGAKVACREADPYSVTSAWLDRIIGKS